MDADYRPYKAYLQDIPEQFLIIPQDNENVARNNLIGFKVDDQSFQFYEFWAKYLNSVKIQDEKSKKEMLMLDKPNPGFMAKVSIKVYIMQYLMARLMNIERQKQAQQQQQQQQGKPSGQ